MPEWGLTRITRETRPYGLDPWWLEPGKVITDPIHGDVFVTRLEQMLLDTPPLQRLRRVRQLGTTQVAYPGATHTRFSHVLGAVQVVQTLLDAVMNQRNRADAPADLFLEWEADAKAAEKGGEREDAATGPNIAEEEPWRLLYRRWLAEATVLARLGALLHDVGHLPFGHTIEDDLALLTPHDENGYRLDLIWREILNSCKHQIAAESNRREDQKWGRERVAGLGPLRSGERLHGDLRLLILSKGKDPQGKKIDVIEKISYPFVADMVGNTICADLLDYLQRDHVFSGLPISLGRRFLSSFYITPKAKAGLYKKRMALLTHRAGRERKDIISEILKHLRYRYELQERVLVHHTKLAADAMVGKMIERWLDARRSELEAQPAAEWELPRSKAKFTYPGEDRSKQDKLERAARFSLEELFRQHGDDGVLEHLAQLDGAPAYEDAAELARMLLDRRLYKPAANAIRPAAADGLFEKFGPGEERLRLERAAAEHAELDRDWHVVLWIPDPEMRLKQAELLVDDGKGITQFKDAYSRGSDIYDAHKELWTISVFVHPSVTRSQTWAVLAKLAKEMGLLWDAFGEELGSDPDVAPEHLAAIKACEMQTVEGRVQELVKRASAPERVSSRAAGGAETQKSLDRLVKADNGSLPKL